MYTLVPFYTLRAGNSLSAGHSLLLKLHLRTGTNAVSPRPREQRETGIVYLLEIIGPQVATLL